MYMISANVVGFCFIFSLIWLLIIIVACIFLSYLITKKVQYLNTKPKNVNLDFNYNATLKFPAVTICNESPYKYV